MTLSRLKKEMHGRSDKKKAKILSGFFKTGQGQYGEGDIFLGITVPTQRELAAKYSGVSLNEIQSLLSSKTHEHRLVALLILIKKYNKSEETGKKEIFGFYLKNTKYINSWDLVDLSAPNIPGSYLLDKNRNILYSLAKSDNLWERRIAVLSCFSFIRNNDFKDILKLSEKLLKDEHDLIHKAVGWMLREMGKRNEQVLLNFLSKNHKKMPRTMLRYSIEKLNQEKKKFYLGR